MAAILCSHSIAAWLFFFGAGIVARFFSGNARKCFVKVSRAVKTAKRGNFQLGEVGFLQHFDRHFHPLDGNIVPRGKAHYIF